MHTVTSTRPRRILVYGVTGSGKTTLAAEISRRTGIPWHSVDDITWQPGWVSTPDDEQVEIITDRCAQDEWILDTAYGKWLHIPLARVELIVALDYPRWFSLMRLLRRTLARVIDRNPVCNGNVETLRQMLSMDSILLWHFRSFRSKRRRIRQWAAEAEGPQVVVLRSARETQRWLATLADEP